MVNCWYINVIEIYRFFVGYIYMRSFNTNNLSKHKRTYKNT